MTVPVPEAQDLPDDRGRVDAPGLVDSLGLDAPGLVDAQDPPPLREPQGPSDVTGLPVGVVAVVPAKDEEERVAATVEALRRVPGVLHVVVVDDGSTDQTAAVAEWTGGVEVVRHDRNRGKAAAMTTGAQAAGRLFPGAPVLFVDADLTTSAGNLGPLVAAVLDGTADMTIAVLPPQDRPGGGFGIVVRTAREGIRRLTGWAPTQPLSGQRCLTREALDAALPLAHGWGVEVGLTVDVLRAGGRVMEVPCELHHRVTGTDWSSQVHRARQLADVTRALAERTGPAERAREQVEELRDAGARRVAGTRSAGAARAQAARTSARSAVSAVASTVSSRVDRGRRALPRPPRRDGTWHEL
ncbi:glycosyltransferase [Ornithinimicrobium sp. W1679]|uniref:glycosyltransferase n=1 Tax=Ornithinimicrobium sp. W1679 TaxID=3418770 RepID=UPI003CE9470E